MKNVSLTQSQSYPLSGNSQEKLDMETPVPELSIASDTLKNTYEKLPSQTDLLQIFLYDPETGALFRKKTGKETGAIAGAGYKTTTIKRKTCLVHRVIWKLLYNEEPVEIDHINHIKTDNSRINLRATNHHENHRNTALRSDNASGICGIARSKRNPAVWVARMKINGKELFLGHFKTIEEAQQARKTAEQNLSFHENHGKPIPHALHEKPEDLF